MVTLPGQAEGREVVGQRFLWNGIDPQETWAYAHLDGVQQVFSCVIATWDHLAEALRIGGPQNDDLV